TSLSHLILGLGLSLAPVGAYIAVTGKFHLLPIPLSIAVFSWVAGFDIIYALQDVDFDKQQKLFSIPAYVGINRALHISSFLHMITFACLVWEGMYAGFDGFYWAGAAIFSALLIFQHLIVKPADLSRVNLSFFTTNGTASIIFCVFVLAELLR